VEVQGLDVVAASTRSGVVLDHVEGRGGKAPLFDLADEDAGFVPFDNIFASFFYFRLAFVSFDRPTQLGDPDRLFRLAFFSGCFFVFLPYQPQRCPRRGDVPTDLLRNVAFKRIRMEAKGVDIPVIATLG